MDTAVLPDPTITAPAPETPAAEPQATPDPFGVDETVLATLSPEQRSAIDPVLSTWKKTALDQISKERESAKPYTEKAKALDQLVNDPRFVNWYKQQYMAPAKAPDPEPKAAPPGVSHEEWSDALIRLNNGDSSKWETLNKKLLEPTFETLKNKQDELAMSMEMNDLFQKHPDAKGLDSIRVSDHPKAPSLLEMALFYVHDLNHGSMDDAYVAAKALQDKIMTEAKKSAMGLVQEKKQAVTEGAPTATNNESVVYVDTPDQALREQIKAEMQGRKVTFAVRRK